MVVVRRRDVTGQATVELVALLPVVCVVVLAAWQLALLGWGLWSAESSARAAARALAVGADPAAVVARGARVLARSPSDGVVVVRVPVRSVLGGGRVLTRVRASSRFERQR
jgi:hypothetical protein